KKLHKILGVNAEDIVISNPFFQRKTTRHAGCQIDYMIQNRFGTLYVCEIKFSKHPLRSDVIQEVRDKINRLSLSRNTACRPVLIHVNGVTDEVSDSDYFSDIIDFSTLLEDENAEK